MSIVTINESAVTAAVLAYLRTVADLSTDDSGHVGQIEVGDGVAPKAASEILTQINRITGEADPYLVVKRSPIGLDLDQDDRGGYASPTPSSKLVRYQIIGLGVSRLQAEQIAILAADRIVDAARALVVAGHSITAAARTGSGGSDREGRLFQHIELIDLDVSLAP